MKEKTSLIPFSRWREGGSKVRKRKENFKSCVFFKNSIVEARERREREGWLDALKTDSDWVPF